MAKICGKDRWKSITKINLATHDDRKKIERTPEKKNRWNIRSMPQTGPVGLHAKIAKKTPEVTWKKL